MHASLQNETVDDEAALSPGPWEWAVTELEVKVICPIYLPSRLLTLVSQAMGHARSACKAALDRCQATIRDTIFLLNFSRILMDNPDGL